MEIERAMQIFDSLGVIEVSYRGIPVWINQINDDRIQVQDLNTNKHLEVSVYDLVEG